MAIAIVGLLIASGCTTPKPTPQPKKLCEPTTREQLGKFGQELKSQGGVWGSSEPFLYFPEKTSSCTNGYFPCSSSEWDGLPIDGKSCTQFFGSSAKNLSLLC